MASITVLIPIGVLLVVLSTGQEIPVSEADVPAECQWKLPKGDEKVFCCKMPTPKREKPDEAKRKVFGECMKAKAAQFSKDSGQRVRLPSFRGGRECFSECFYNSSGLLTPDGKLNENPIRKMSMDIAGADEGWKSASETALSACFGDKAIGQNPDSTCKSGSSKFTRCLMRQMYLNCPSSSWTNTEGCQKQKERMKNCPNGFSIGRGPPKRN